MKVLFQHHALINENYKAFFRSNLPKEINLVFVDNNKQLLDEIKDSQVFVGYSVNEEFMENAKSLRHIQIPWTGFNSLDTELVKKFNDIIVSNSHSNSLAIAEHAVALFLSAAKLLVMRDKYMRKGDWSPRYKDINSYWVTGKKLGVLGYGAIGKKVAGMMKSGFNMEILAIKRTKEEKDDICSFLGTMGDLEKVLQESDFLLVAVPLTEETKGMLGEEEFIMMKDTAVVVNIARGPVIEEKALFESLRDKKIGAAGIDVWYNYPNRSEDSGQTDTKQNYPFEELDNIVMSPHSAFKVRDREEEFAQDILENIRRVYENREPINQVNLELGY